MHFCFIEKKSSGIIFFVGIFLTCVLTVSLTGCTNDDSYIPDATVYIERNINTYKLYTTGSYLYIDEKNIDKEWIGYGGVLIVRDFNDEFHAYDLSCTNERSSKIRISEPNESLICTCETCGEQYNLGWGFGEPLNGISKRPLKQYNITVNEYNYIIVTN